MGGLLWGQGEDRREWRWLWLLTIDLRIKERRLLALFSANSRLLMSLSRALYLFICSITINSTQLWGKKTQKNTRWEEEMILPELPLFYLKVCSDGKRWRRKLQLAIKE